jgi:hypothetical protein
MEALVGPYLESLLNHQSHSAECCVNFIGPFLHYNDRCLMTAWCKATVLESNRTFNACVFFCGSSVNAWLKYVLRVLILRIRSDRLQNVSGLQYLAPISRNKWVSKWIACN